MQSKDHELARGTMAMPRAAVGIEALGRRAALARCCASCPCVSQSRREWRTLRSSASCASSAMDTANSQRGNPT